MTFKITVYSYKDRHFPKQAPDYQICQSKASQFLQNRSLSTVFTDNMQITDMGEVQPKKKNIGQNKRSTLVSETKWDPQNSQEQEHNPNMAQNTMELWQKVPTLENNTAWFLARGWFPWKYEVFFSFFFTSALKRAVVYMETWRQGFQSGPKMGKWYLLFYMETEILGFQCYWYLLFYMETGIWGFPCYWCLLFYMETEILGF